MNIFFSPVSMFETYTLAVAGNSVVINGTAHSIADMLSLEEGELLPDFIVGVTEDSVTVILPYWGAAPDYVLYPEPLYNVPDGPVALPGQPLT